MLRRLDWRLVAITVAILIIAFCTWHWSEWQRRAGIAAGFGARIACSCRLVEGRDIGSCRTDFRRLNGMGWVRIADAADGRGVEASVPLLARRSARIVPGFGCVIDNR
jgi:peptidoglycan/LPS O-acetylase OafA/YrhL